MKKSRQIQLVLITAALASCNRAIVPQMPVTDKPDPADSTLTAGPVYNGEPYGNAFNLCCQESWPQLWGNAYYYPGRLYRRGAFWKNGHFIVRGGWGKSGASASS